MNTQDLQSQQLNLLARKALLNDELVQIDRALGQIGAIVQFAQAQAQAPCCPSAPEGADANPAA